MSDAKLWIVHTSERLEVPNQHVFLANVVEYFQDDLALICARSRYRICRRHLALYCGKNYFYRKLRAVALWFVGYDAMHVFLTGESYEQRKKNGMVEFRVNTNLMSCKALASATSPIVFCEV